MNQRVNPFEKDGKWYWYDETGDISEPYRSAAAANRALRRYVYWLDNGPTRWQRFWWPIRYALKTRNLTSTSPKWIASVRIMRVATPVAAILAAGTAVFAWKYEMHGSMVLGACLFGANAVLSWINWFVLSMPKAGTLSPAERGLLMAMINSPLCTGSIHGPMGRLVELGYVRAVNQSGPFVSGGLTLTGYGDGFVLTEAGLKRAKLEKGEW